jgi:hypothetical protein
LAAACHNPADTQPSETESRGAAARGSERTSATSAALPAAFVFAWSPLRTAVRSQGPRSKAQGPRCNHTFAITEGGARETRPAARGQQPGHVCLLGWAT